MFEPARGRHSRTFRVFVSSAFIDMHAERDALQQRTFPRLQRYCRARGASFQAIDLRWGVSRELVEQNEVLSICLDEVERCKRQSPRPRLLVLLGDRYGWIPPPTSIARSTFESVRASSTAAERQLLDACYELDSCGDAVEFVLPRRERSSERRIDMEAQVCVLLRSHLELVSATEAEVRRALSGELPPNSCFAYFRKLIVAPAAVLPAAYRQVEFAAELAGLRSLLVDRLGHEHCTTLAAFFDGTTVSAEYLSSLCEDVFERLRRSIDEQLGSAGGSPPRPASLELVPASGRSVSAEQLLPRLVELHGRKLVLRTLASILVSRRGLAEDELLDLASADEVVLKEVHSRFPDSPRVERLPVVLWSRLRHDLEPHLRERTAHGLTLLALSDAVQSVFWQLWAVDEQLVRETRFNVAHYFSTQGGGIRYLDEMAWLAYSNENWPALATALTHRSLFDYLAREEPELLRRYRVPLSGGHDGPKPDATDGRT